ncbi:hypothetical protein EVAR_23100_1 [Eumeta japonica]|uniref:Uncharacterized protein n=1 Tax=Eumeta variegata TaxID=151549 RepID=A0A4C1VPH4_EUMVA|nr:hypothetical protein EVAR_23100_1 [Eumeta japonica]
MLEAAISMTSLTIRVSEMNTIGIGGFRESGRDLLGRRATAFATFYYCRRLFGGSERLSAPIDELTVMRTVVFYITSSSMAIISKLPRSRTIKYYHDTALALDFLFGFEKFPGVSSKSKFQQIKVGPL